MNTRELNYVAMVAEERSFSKAAKKLFISQPSLSEFIKKVEKDLGYELFDRTVSPLKLTMAGEVYMETARRILDLEREMGKRLIDIEGKTHGKLRVGVSPYNGLMPSAIQRFFEFFPDYEVYLQDSVGTVERLRLLEQGELDLCIQPIYEPLHSRFVMEEIMTDDLILAVPADHPLNSKLTSSQNCDFAYPVIEVDMLRLLTDVPFVSVGGNKHLRKSVDELFDTIGVKPNVVVTCQKSEGCLDMVISGVGASIVQGSLIRYRVIPSKVRYYLIRQNIMSYRIGAIYIRDRYLSRAARTFIDIMKTF